MRKIGKAGVLVGIIVLTSLLYIVYIAETFVEVPYLSAFDFLHIAEHYYQGTLTLSDFINSYTEHGMLGANIIFFINVVLFRFSVAFEEVINVINTVVFCVVCVYLSSKGDNSDGKILNKAMFYLMTIVMSAFAFGPMQQGLSGMDMQVRLGMLFSFLILVYYDKVLHSCKDKKNIGKTMLIILVGTNVFGTIYSFSAIPVSCCIVIALWIKNRKIDFSEFIIMLFWAICSVGYFFEYKLIGYGNVNSGNISPSIIDMLKSPYELARGALIYSASFVIGSAPYYDGLIPVKTYALVGILVFFVIVASIICFFWAKMYEKTWLPLFMIGYAYFVWFLASASRWNTGAKEGVWLINEWYWVHTRMASIATIWIIGYCFSYVKGIRKSILIIFMLCMVIPFIWGTVKQYKRAPGVKAYYANMQKYLYVDDQDYMPVENGTTPLRTSLEASMYAIDVMRKYRLSVYKYFDAYEGMMLLEDKPIDAFKYSEQE
ncbi:hypothetical protein [Butyrivibrio sp. MB2005]|uniref:hypothetical protein n=1 Tax=Butyrivibrio sp. MB2005 TaxID=1280678 RepID=UPI00040D837D|nr:hypothetical protein [Butyrivibrio sp. MB2005]